MTGHSVESRGAAVLGHPIHNRGTGFTLEERDALGLHGLLPPVVETLEQQAQRAWEAFGEQAGDLARHVNLRQLQDTNETLFYRVLVDHVEETLPAVYTPTVGLACQRFSHIYRRSRGLFVSYPNRDRLRELIANRPEEDVDVIVVTDGQRILGLGDQGIGGMGIPIGKLSLYTAIGGIHPARTLPVILDVGTDNRDLLDDPTYLGWRHERIAQDEYLAFVDEFVDAVQAELPDVLLQWEDFATPHARPILELYRDRLCTFNDDIQGTAAVALGALLGAVGVSGGTLRDQRIVMLGAGSAGIGVADRIHAEMVADGATSDEARARFWVVDADGLLTRSRTGLSPEQQAYARVDETRPLGLADVVGQAQPTALIGLSTAHGAFTEDVVRRMAAGTDRPIIFPLSNPTSRSEADPADLFRWTDGRALVATGSPYPAVDHDGNRVPIAQSNNVFIFPAVGLGVVASGARRVTDEMLAAAARSLGELSPARTDPLGALLPPVSALRGVARELAFAVATTAVEQGVAPAASADELRAAIAATQWEPAYD